MPTCVFCGNVMLNHLNQHDAACRYGCVYSEAGYKEVKISQVCEYCFDKTFPPED